MHDLPASLRFVQDSRPSIEEPYPIVEMKGRNRHVSDRLHCQFSLLDVHIGSGRFAVEQSPFAQLSERNASPTAYGTSREICFSHTRCSLSRCTSSEQCQHLRDIYCILPDSRNLGRKNQRLASASCLGKLANARR